MKYTTLIVLELPHQIGQINTMLMLKLKLLSTTP